jgi:hexosaminidase
MKKALIVLICLVVVNNVFAQTPVQFNLIPQPTHIIKKTGAFSFSKKILISTSDNQKNEDFKSVIKDQLTIILESKSIKSKSAATINFKLNTNIDKSIGDEGYILNIATNAINISANTEKGWFYAWQTLAQLLKLSNNNTVPAMIVKDQPKLQWRGLMIDVSRHFFPKPIILRYIDQMAKYKFNVLHFHLTDNQGWRVEIKQLPKLTSVGAWRVPRTGYWKDMKAPETGEEATYGGFYSQEDIKEIVKYAKNRFVDVVPEIDLPGHSLAFVASYPEISCTKTPQKVLAGDPWNASRTNVLCVGNDSVYVKLDQIFTEIASLFPSKYIHIGGDEVSRAYWQKCADCQKRIQTENLNNVDELQTYFINRVAKIITSKGKTPVGWFDNLPGKLDQNLVLMSWKDDKGGIKSTNEGHKVIMTPAFFTYLDFYQGDPFLENAMFTVNRLSNTFKFNPLPEGIKAENVLGGQGSLWTEQVPNERKLQFMTWPRAFALAEKLWQPNTTTDWNTFAKKIEMHLPLLDTDTVKYSKQFYEPIVIGHRNNLGKTELKLNTEISDLNIYYSFDDTDPDQFYPKYQNIALQIPKGAKNIRAVSYRNNIKMSKVIKLPISELERRIKP